MRNYLEAIICEQIERGSCLKALIPHPMKYPELTGLAERCGRIIDENIEFLQSLNQQLGSRTESDIRDILRELRICYRNIAFVEAYGIPVLYYSQTTEMKYLNKLIFKIYQEKMSLEEASVYDFMDMLRCSPDASKEVIQHKFDSFKSTAIAINDSEIRSFLNMCEEKFKELLTT